MPLIPSTAIVVIEPGLVEVVEDGERYLMHEADAMIALESVRKYRDFYANEIAWQRRVEHYESVLVVLRASKEILQEKSHVEPGV